MKKITYICDRCHKEIESNPMRFFADSIDRENDDFICDDPYPDMKKKDFCKDCCEFLVGLIRKSCKKGVPAVINQEFESAVQDMIATSQQEKDPLPTDKPKRRLDTGKIMALRNAGWSVKAISEEMNCSEQGIYNVLNKKKAPEQKPTEQSNDN
ncbi:MAG: hypothetical protein ACI4EX_01685 [Lachnospiraceae bacterium]